LLDEAQAAARQAIGSMTGEVEALRSDCDGLRRDVGGLGAECHSLREERDQLLDRVKALQVQADESRPLRGELDDVRADSGRLRAELGEALSQLTASRAEIEAAESLGRQLQETRADRERLDEEVATLQAERSRLEAALAEEATRYREPERQELPDDQEQGGRGQHDGSRPGEESAGSDTDRRRLEGQLEEALRQADQYRVTFEEERERLGREIDTRRRELERLAADLDGLRSDLRESERHRQAEAAGLGREVEQGRARAEELTRLNEGLNKQLHGLRAEIYWRQEGLVAEREEHKRVLAALRVELETARAARPRSSAVPAEGDGHRDATESPPVSDAAKPREAEGVYNDMFLSEYDSEAFRRNLRGRSR